MTNEARRARPGAARACRSVAIIPPAGAVPGTVDRGDGRRLSIVRFATSPEPDVYGLVNGSRHRLPDPARRRVRAAHARPARPAAAGYALTLGAILIATSCALAIGTGLAYLVGFVMILLGAG